MAKARFRVSAAARQDMLGIGRFTQQQWGKIKRNDYLAQLDRAFELISANPLIGSGCDEIVQGYRKYSQGSHIIYYRVTDRVEIIRVLHERMDPDSRLL
jgi:toxin ParE1/3/4